MCPRSFVETEESDMKIRKEGKIIWLAKFVIISGQNLDFIAKVHHVNECYSTWPTGTIFLFFSINRGDMSTKCYHHVYLQYNIRNDLPYLRSICVIQWVYCIWNIYISTFWRLISTRLHLNQYPITQTPVKIFGQFQTLGKTNKNLSDTKMGLNQVYLWWWYWLM